MTYFSVNPENLYLTGLESPVKFWCVLSTDLPRNNWTFGWSDGHENLTTGRNMNGKLFTTDNINSTLHSSVIIGTILTIRTTNSTSLFSPPTLKQIYCYAFNKHNNMKLNSKIGYLYDLSK